MLDWWPTIGEMSVWTGSAVGLVWSTVSTVRRRGKFASAGLTPVGQLKWFALCFMSMGAFVALGTALGLASLHGLLPPALFWFLLGLGAIAFGAALLFPSIAAPVRLTDEHSSMEPPAAPPILPLRKSA